MTKLRTRQKIFKKIYWWRYDLEVNCLPVDLDESFEHRDQSVFELEV
ncbi:MULTISPECIES: hypothetical protein [Bacillus]|nr:MULTISPECIES: hypothetical protein [Bacillus]MCQ6574583.1 hypothetical protein [Bacillus wiedmannii]MCU5110747.1 hypothetical protein [Bacillus wiedmannii]MCU5150502.1 hypothetical protein [Bacillus wiedmannii]MCU5410858.1 hypothetical protein [Bacillus wiedmannii]MCU5576995.1 hypothetical protein [Bacillus wiedmannii]